MGWETGLQEIEETITEIPEIVEEQPKINIPEVENIETYTYTQRIHISFQDDTLSLIFLYASSISFRSVI